MASRTPLAGFDLVAARRVATEAARAAGELLRERARCGLGLRTKDASGDVVSDLDLASEALIVERLRYAYPTHRVIAEEGGESGGGDGSDDEWTWLVDPLDGTNNLAIGLPAYVVGIALCYAGRPVVGVVHDPTTELTYSAVIGHGASGPTPAPLRPAPRVGGGAPLVAWTQGHHVRRDDAGARALRFVLESGARRVLSLWAPLVGWTMLARGDIDGFVGYEPEAVDLPAGALIAREAGLELRALDGTPYDPRFDLPPSRRGFVAGRPDLIPDLLTAVKRAGELAPDVAALLEAAR